MTDYWPQPRAVTQPYWLPLPPVEGPPAPLEALVDGEAVETAHGPFFRRRQVLPLDECYGACRLGDFLDVDPQAAAALSRQPDLGAVSFDRVLFLDTETTGLAGGTGTYAFLVGLGFFDRLGGETRFVVEQCMMRSYAEERAMLSWVAERLQRFEALATFNGRVFDVPLLQTRFLMSRMRLDLEEWLHFDLLPPARRLWRAAVGSCALQNLERQLLGVGRDVDVESFLIPAIYHQYLRDGDGRFLRRVFNHNHADILAMVALSVRACRALGGSSSEAGSRQPAHLTPAEYLGLARVYEQLGNAAAAEAAYRDALRGRLPAALRARALLDLGGLLKRARRYDEAAVVWQVLADELPAQSVTALVELAKYWEHQRRDPARAQHFAATARDRWLACRVPRERPLPGMHAWRASPIPVPPDDFGRRLARLNRKQAQA